MLCCITNEEQKSQIPEGQQDDKRDSAFAPSFESRGPEAASQKGDLSERPGSQEPGILLQNGAVPPDARPLRAMVMAILTLLWVEFLLGMYANLDVSFPPKGSGRGGMHVVMDHFGLMLHMVIGILLVILGMIATALAGKVRSQPAMWLSLGGLVSLVAAGAGGLIFVLGDQSNAASYVMAVGFLAAFSCYFAELIATRHHTS